MMISPYLRSAAGGALIFWCPGCKGYHAITVGDGPRPRWGYNGNPHAPTFEPSILVRSGHFADGHKEGDTCLCTFNQTHTDDPEFRCVICHSFVRDGQIQFLGDCTHALAGQTVPLPELPA